MNRIAVASAIVIGELLAGGTRARSVDAQQPRVCLHGADETAGEKLRRYEAVGFVRSVNTAQARFRASSKRYAQIAELSDVRPVPVGFTVQHAANADGYIFSVKDRTDQCFFSLYSDQVGTIYEAGPMR